RGTSRRRGFATGASGLGSVPAAFELGFAPAAPELVWVGAGVDWLRPGSTSSSISAYAPRSEVRKLGLDPGLGRGLRNRLSARHHHFGFALSDAGRLAGEMTQVVQLGAADPAAAHHRDLGDHRAMERENALDAN